MNNNGNKDLVLGNKSGTPLENDWLLSIGNAKNKNDTPVKLDSSNPHVIFVCGARGSGKSYTLGVLAEEISRKNSDIGAVIVDPIGIFWSMKYPNKEEEELELLRENNLKPEGMENVEVLIPSGYASNIPDETFEGSFSFQPSSLTADDWCLTFGIDRYSPQGLLLERAIEKVKTGYTRQLGDKGDRGSRDVDSNANFSIEDLLDCINHDKELLSKKKGFKASTRRALTSRLSTAKEWGIFGKEKKLSDIIRKGTINVFDISFLPENIGSLVLGILARKILAARKKTARKEAVKDLKGEKRDEDQSIPPTWLMIDEAHSFAPSSGKTAATNPLVEYVKEGRRPGLSAVLSTQQPSALDSKIISQLDILLSHQLSFEKDIKEVWKRMPTSLPDDLKNSESLKKLPEGTAIVADKEINQGFFVSIRPRLSQHEGRERVIESTEDEKDSESSPPVKDETTSEDIEETFERIEIEPDDQIGEEEKEEDNPNDIDIKPDEDEDKEEILTVPFRTSMKEANEVAEAARKRRLKFLWPIENIRRVSRHYYPFWSFLVDYYPKNEKQMNLRVQIDGISGEIIKKGNGKIRRTRGVRSIPRLSSFEKKLLFRILETHPTTFESLENFFDSKSKVKSSVSRLEEQNLVKCTENETEVSIDLQKNVDIPRKLSQKPFLAAESIPNPKPKMVREEQKKEEVIDSEKALEILDSFGDIEVIEEKLYYYPYWIAKFVRDGQSRLIAIDGVFGNCDEYAGRMFRRRVL